MILTTPMEVKMIRVNVFILNVSADRFWDIKKPIPAIKINTNLNLLGVEKKTEGSLEVPFVLTINYNPSIAQINLKGKAHVVGDQKELVTIYEEYQQKKPPSPVIVQSISNVVFTESVIISKTLNIPPPIPMPQIPHSKIPRKKPETEYSI